MQRLLFASFVLLDLMPSAVLALPNSYTFSRVDVPGSIATEIHGINDQGQIVGAYYGSDGRPHGFLLANGNFTTIDFPGSITTTAQGIKRYSKQPFG